MITNTTHLILNVKKAVSRRHVWYCLEVKIDYTDRETKQKPHPDHGENDETEPENLNLSLRELDLVLG